MGIYDEKLGEYKVALSVDYKKFHEGMKSAMDLMTETAGTMNRTAEDLSAVLALHFDTMTKTVNTGVESMKADINSLTEMLKGGNDIKGFSNSLETELKRITEKYKAAVKEIQAEIGKTVNVPDSGSSGGGKSSDSVSEYTKRTRLRSKGATEVAETGAVSDETIKAYNEVDTHIKKNETSLNAIRKAQNDLNKLAEQYNAIQQKVANTITAQGKLSETTLASYRSQIANIVQEHQRLRSVIGNKATDDFVVKGFLPNLLEKGGAYEQNVKKADRDAEESERIKSLDKLRNKYRELYAEVQQRIRETARLSERQFNSMNRQIDKVVMEMRRLGDMSAVNPLAEQFGRNYGGYIKSFNDNLKESVKTTNMLVDGFTSLKHHIMWMVSATALATTVGIPASVVASYKDTERQMAGMIQVLPQLHHNQSELNRTATEFIGIAQRYGMSVHDIIEAGKQNCPIAA